MKDHFQRGNYSGRVYDVLFPYSKGFKNVISNSGTALTENQINLMKFFQTLLYALMEIKAANKLQQE